MYFYLEYDRTFWYYFLQKKNRIRGIVAFNDVISNDLPFTSKGVLLNKRSYCRGTGMLNWKASQKGHTILSSLLLWHTRIRNWTFRKVGVVGSWFMSRNFSSLNYRPQMKFAKVMFLQVSVCSHRGHAWLLLGGHAWLLPGGVHGCSQVGVWLLQGACMVAPGRGMRSCTGGMCGCSQGCVRGCSWGVCVVAPEGHVLLLLGGHAWDMRYDQWAGSMHPTGMHSCFFFKRWNSVVH